MKEIDEQRVVREARRAVQQRTGEPTRYAAAVNRYLGALGYAAGVDRHDRPTAVPTRAPATVAKQPVRHTVVVGVDDSPSSVVAVDHAAIEAELRGWDIRLVHVQRPLGHRPTDRDDGAALLEHLIDRVHACSTNVAAVSRLHVGFPAVTLVDHAMDAGLVVVGSRHGRAKEALGGSVSGYVASHHPGPVLVVRVPGWPAGGQLATRPVVAGVDGSPAGRAAAAFAAEEARLRGCDLVLLHATDGRFGGGDPLDDIPADVLAGVTVRRRRIDADARAALAEASFDAAAVVVGGGERRGLSGVLLGGVSRMLVYEAHCPVFVVHQPVAR
jgi:nucleotide-binding universal stress UspA family protein